MSEVLQIEGGRALTGTVKVSGAKNASLPLLIASLLTEQKCKFNNVPNLEDVRILLQLLESLGANSSYNLGSAILVIPNIISTEASYSLVKALRASFWVLAPLLARCGEAHVALPGGDAIGARPVDIHLEALKLMGADIEVKNGVVHAIAKHGLKPAHIQFRFPSVGATHQIVMAAALTKGQTIIDGAAKEPEVVAVCDFISKMGAQIEGAGSSRIIINGTDSLSGAEIDIIGDRIEAGTYIMAACATAGVLTLNGINPTFFGSFLTTLEDLGVGISTTDNSISIDAKNKLRPISVKTAPFPLFPTDLQAPVMAALTVADGISYIEEHMFEGRFGHISELCRMGANIQVREHIATITGVSKLTGAHVDGLDIRAAAALVIAGLAAEGVTTIHEVSHLNRGYEKLTSKLQLLGAKVWMKLQDADDYMFSGC